jgi:hypothetical protein
MATGEKDVAVMLSMSSIVTALRQHRVTLMWPRGRFETVEGAIFSTGIKMVRQE